MVKRLTIATGGSPLALWQAHHVKKLLEARHAELHIELFIVSAQAESTGKGLVSPRHENTVLVSMLEYALLDGQADVVVHAMQDVPTHQPDGLHFGTLLKRGNPRNAFVSNAFYSPADLPVGARVGTRTLCRQAQLHALFHGIEVVNLQHDTHACIAQLDAGEVDALVLSVADLKRLQMSQRITSELPIDCCLPAAGQGALGIQCRTRDTQTNQYVGVLHDHLTAARVMAERAFRTRLEGQPYGLTGAYAFLRGNRVRADDSAPLANASMLGTRLAEQMIEQGGKRLVAAAKCTSVPQVVAFGPVAEPLSV